MTSASTGKSSADVILVPREKHRCKLQLGDTLVLPLCFQPGLRKEGTVVYIHPEKRFFTAEFDCGENSIRESYCAHGKLE